MGVANDALAVALEDLLSSDDMELASSLVDVTKLD